MRNFIHGMLVTIGLTSLALLTIGASATLMVIAYHSLDLYY